METNNVHWLEVNMRAAQMFGLDVKVNHNGVFYEYADQSMTNWIKRGRFHFFDLRTSAEDRESVVILLGEKYGTSIMHYDGDGPPCWCWDNYNLRGKACASYIECLADAVMEVAG